MHFLPTALLLLSTLTSTSVLAKPLPTSSSSTTTAAAAAARNLDLAEIERRWSAGETEVCQPLLNQPGCYIYAWFHSMARFCRGEEDASIHKARSYRDATPAWPVQREALPEEFSYATDERTMMRAQRQRRSENGPLLAKMKHFVNDFYRSRGTSDHGVIARDAQDAAPVLKPRTSMKYAFKA